MKVAEAEPGISMVTTGDGPTVVLVHGAAGDYRQWMPIVGLLQSRYRLSSVSRRYHWPNPPLAPGDVYCYETQRDDLLVLLRAVGHPVHLVGHSYGAGLALLAALEGPGAIRSLTLIEPALGSLVTASAEGLEAELSSRNSTLKAVADLAAAGRDEQATELFFDWIQGRTGGFADLSDEVKRGLLENAKTIGPTFATRPPDVTCHQVRNLGIPTLVLNGDHTRLWYRLCGAAAAACIDGARSDFIPDASHMTIVENPDRTAALLEGFFERH